MGVGCGYWPGAYGDDKELEGSWTRIRKILTGSYLLQEAFSDLPSSPRLGDDKGAPHKQDCDKEIPRGCGSLERRLWKAQAEEERGIVSRTGAQAAAGSFVVGGRLAISKNALSE